MSAKNLRIPIATPLHCILALNDFKLNDFKSQTVLQQKSLFQQAVGGSVEASKLEASNSKSLQQCKKERIHWNDSLARFSEHPGHYLRLQRLLTFNQLEDRQTSIRKIKQAAVNCSACLFAKHSPITLPANFRYSWSRIWPDSSKFRLRGLQTLDFSILIEGQAGGAHWISSLDYFRKFSLIFNFE